MQGGVPYASNFHFDKEKGEGMLGQWSLSDVLVLAGFSAALWITLRALLQVNGMSMPWDDW